MLEIEKLSNEVNYRIRCMQETLDKIEKTEDLDFLLEGKEILYEQIAWFSELEINNSPIHLTGGVKKVKKEVGTFFNERLFYIAMKAIEFYRTKKHKHKLTIEIEKQTFSAINLCLDNLILEGSDFYMYNINLEDFIQELSIQDQFNQ